MENALTRRAAFSTLAGGVVACAVAAIVTNGAAMANSVSNVSAPDAHWEAIVADYRKKYAVWVATIDVQEEAEDAFLDALASLPEPKSSKEDPDYWGMTIAEMVAFDQTPERKVAHAAYTRARDAWTREKVALRQKIVGPADAQYNATYAKRESALAALIAYPVTTFGQLREKIEIISAEYQGDDVPQNHLAAILSDVCRFEASGTPSSNGEA
jgi:hypothetical protein